MKTTQKTDIKRANRDKVIGTLLGGYDFICASCGMDCFGDTPLCPDCEKKLTINNGNTCKKCGRALIGEGDYCLICKSHQHTFDRAFSPVLFDNVAQRICHDLKFGNERWLARYMAEQMAGIYRANALCADIVTFVPMNDKEQKERQYNQSHLLCTHFCDILNLPTFPLLKKCKTTLKQEQCHFKQRFENLKDAFELDGDVDICGKSVVLIDDVMTTGATADSCADTLKKHGAQAVYVITYASRKEMLLTE